MQAGMVTEDGKGCWPDRAAPILDGFQQQARPMGSMPLFATRILLARSDSFHARSEALVCFAQIVQQTRQLGVLFALEKPGGCLRPACHANEMLDKRLVRVREELV